MLVPTIQNSCVLSMYYEYAMGESLSISQRGNVLRCCVGGKRVCEREIEVRYRECAVQTVSRLR